MMDVTIYHNPDCGTSRSALGLIQGCGIEPRVVEYLKTPPARDKLVALLHEMGMSVREILRERGTPFAALGLGDPAKGDDALLDAIRQHPILINRPIVATEKGVRLCRPSDMALDLLPVPPRRDLRRDDGTSFLRDEEVQDVAEVAAAMDGAGLPTEDLAEPNRTFFRYARLDGEVVGHGGFELHGENALLRSLAVQEPFRRQGNGGNMLALLMRRAYDRGARQAYALADSEASRAFFAGARFDAIERSSAPASILGTRQASSLCPASATLFTRRITF